MNWVTGPGLVKELGFYALDGVVGETGRLGGAFGSARGHAGWQLRAQ